MPGSSFDAAVPGLVQPAAGNEALFGNVRRLVPASGVQFVDCCLPHRPLAAIRSWFTEDKVELPGGPRHVLLPLSSEAGTDGTIWHPVTFKPLGPGETYSFTGLEALEPFLDTWTPVPFLRFLGRDDSGRPRYDSGPSNWARVFLAKPEGGLRGADAVQLVYGFDTRLDPRSRADQAPYLAPNCDDALFASTFMLVYDPGELSDFLGQPWVEAWLRESCEAAGAAVLADDIEEAGFAIARAGDGRFQLAHVGRYLALLHVLARLSAPPQIRFVDTVTRSMNVATTAVDLVIDFGAADTSALIIESDQPVAADLASGPAHAAEIRLRDLERPVDIHRGRIPGAVEFDHQTFGPAALSRRSGRSDAFQWPSLVRIGNEALRLGLRTNATAGITGTNDIGTQLGSTHAAEGVWRFSTPDRDGPPKSAPMVTGEVLRHLTEAGSPLPAFDRLLAGPGSVEPATPAVRPRFSQSSLAGLFMVELLLHALSEVNSAADGAPFAASAAERSDIRRIARIVLMPAFAMPLHERQFLIERVAGAIDLLWRTQGWDQAGAAAVPAKPKLVLGIGPDVGEQVVYLMGEVRSKLGGSFSTLVDCVRRRTGEPDARDNLRVSSLDMNQCSSSLTVIDYAVAHDGTVQASLVLADRSPVGGERVIEAIIERVIVPAVERALSEAGLAQAHRLLADLIARSGAEERGHVMLGRRLFSKILRPAAVGVFETFLGMPQRGAEGLRRFRLDGLVAAGRGRLGPVGQDIEEAAWAAGAKGFRLGSVTFHLGRRQVQALLEAELGPTIDSMAGAVEDSASDILLMAGDLPQLPDLLDRVLALAPVPAGRIVVLGVDDTLPDHGTGREGPAPNGRAVLGAYAAGHSLLETQGFRLATRGLSRTLAGSMRADVPGLAALDDDGRAQPAGEDVLAAGGPAAQPALRAR